MTDRYTSSVELVQEWGYGLNVTRGHRVFVKSTDAALRTRHDFQWPLQGDVDVSATATFHSDPCPKFEGDGLSLAKTWAAAALGGHRLSTVLVVSANPKWVLAEDSDKVRVSKCRVVGVLDWQREARSHGAPGANLSMANLSGANLSVADLGGADLSVADLGGAYLYGAYLSGANLSEANLSEANLSGADLGEAYLSGADLGGAYLYGAYLFGANLFGANVRGAYLSGADLGGAYLYGAYLFGADLSRANLSGADLSGHDKDALRKRGAYVD